MESSDIEVYGATQNNLKNVTLKIPKHQITVFTGLSGSGKSSLVFDTIAAMSRRELNETFPSFTQQYLPKYGQPHVGVIKNLPVAIVIEQKHVGRNARSTLATYTGIYSLLRLLFSRAGQPFVGYSDTFSFNLPQGMCPACQGLGYVDEIDVSKLIDPEKSLNEGGIRFVSFGPGTWRWKRYGDSGLFDNDKPLKAYTPQEMNLLLKAPQQKLKQAPAKWPKTALYEGVIPRIKRSILGKKEAQHHQVAIAEMVTRKPCEQCHGTRLRSQVLHCLINGNNIAEVLAMDLVSLKGFLEKIQPPLVQDLLRELLRKIDSLIEIGLGYLTLDRRTDSLSGGETQRIKIAKFLTSALVDMVYILDEPSVGLHPHDIELIKTALRDLKQKGNTILIVEHNPALISLADHVVEVGPGAGTTGGKITFTGSYQDLLASNTLTGKLLKEKLRFRKVRQAKSVVALRDVHLHNLAHVDIDVPLGIETVISGVAGSGKSSLVQAFRQQLTHEYIDLAQGEITANNRSTPATYLDILDPIRQVFAQATKASVQLFSYNGKGACPRCKGKGVTITNMAFMDPVVQECELCHGQRYNQEALSYHYHGKQISQILAMPIMPALEFFKGITEIEAPLKNMVRVGLAYLTLGQPLTTLSGGEKQRLKLAIQLNRHGTIYLLDEPTAGLHLKNVRQLIALFDELVASGNSLIIVEHNLQVISQADWLIDVGPAAGKYGGKIQFTGTPQASLNAQASLTGQAMRAYNATR